MLLTLGLSFLSTYLHLFWCVNAAQCNGVTESITPSIVSPLISLSCEKPQLIYVVSTYWNSWVALKRKEIILEVRGSIN